MTFVQGSGGAREQRSKQAFVSSAPLPLRTSAHLLLLALFALACGMIASSAIGRGDDWFLPLAMAAVLTVAWMGLWTVIAGVNWAEPLAHWRGWTRGESLKLLPYAQTGSDAAQLENNLGQLKSWLQEEFLPRYGSTLLIGAAAFVVAIVLAAALDAQAVLLTIIVLCVSQIAVILCRGNGRPSSLLHGMVIFALPLLLGYAAFAPLSLPVAVAAVGFGLAVAGVLGASAALRNVGYAIVLALLVVTRQPIGAFVVAILWMPQLLLNRGHDARSSMAWLVASMFSFAIAFA